VGVNTQLEFSNFKSEGSIVHCELVERNDRLDAIGISELKYSSCTFVFKGRLIQGLTAESPPEFVRYNSDIWQKFLPWFSENYPEAYSKMFRSEKTFIYNRKNGAGVVPLLRKWHGEHEK